MGYLNNNNIMKKTVQNEINTIVTIQLFFVYLCDFASGNPVVL